MQIRTPTLALLLGCAISLPASAQTVASDPQALALITQSLTAMVRSATALQDSVTQGTIVWADGTTGTITVKTKGPYRLRHDIRTPLKQLSYVINGGDGFGLRDGTRFSLPLWVTAYQRAEHAPILALAADLNRPNVRITYLGVENVADRPAHHIYIYALPTDDTAPETERLISEFHVYVDSQTLLVAKTQGFLFSPEAIQNRSVVETYYSDYRQLDDFLFPVHLTRFIDGNKDSEIVFSSVQVNAGVADTEFTH